MTDNIDNAQGPASGVVQPMSEIYISPAARWYTSLRMEAQPGTPPAGVPAADGGQGANGGGGTGGGGGGGFNWDMFPDVPVEQRSLLEPHMRGVQGHVTHLEQKYAPYKAVIDAGLSGEDLQGLLNLQRSFNQDPVAAYMRLTTDLQKAGAITDDLDLAVLEQVLKGTVAENPQTPPAGGEGQGEEIPPWAQEMMNWQKNQDEQAKARQAQENAAKGEQLLTQTIDGMKAQLKEAGLTDEQVNDPELDNLMNAAIIASKGDADAAMKSILGFRDSTLKGLNPNPKPGDKGEGELEMPNGNPPTPKRAGTTRHPEYAEARAGAAQFLARKHAAAAQE